MTVNLPPETGDADLDTWTYEITQDVNINTSASVVTDPETGAPSIDGVVLGYTQRYLDTAWGTSNTGADFTTTIGTLPVGTTMIFQGLRNTAMTVESTNPAEFTWRQIVIPTGANITTLLPWYRTVGGRQIDWLFDVAQPLGYTEDDGTAVIDLDIIAGVATTGGVSTRVDLAYAESAGSTGFEIQQITAAGTRSNVVAALPGTNEFLRISLLNTFDGGTTPNATFSFDPDTANSVYNTSISNMALAANVGNEVALTAIGNAIAALETNITWDGLQGTEAGGGGTRATVEIDCTNVVIAAGGPNPAVSVGILDTEFGATASGNPANLPNRTAEGLAIAIFTAFNSEVGGGYNTPLLVFHAVGL